MDFGKSAEIKYVVQEFFQNHPDLGLGVVRVGKVRWGAQRLYCLKGSIKLQPLSVVSE